MSKIVNTLNSCFIQFLKSNGAYTNYKKACYNDMESINRSALTFEKHYVVPENKNWDDEALIRYAELLIMCSFGWGETNEGSIYWNKLYSMWKEVMKKLKYSNYEISKDVSRAVLARGN